MKEMSLTERIIRYIEDNLDKDLSLEKIAEELNYSRFYTARTFKEHTGMTLYKYIQGRRLDEAAKKLADMGYGNVWDFGGILNWPYETTTD